MIKMIGAGLVMAGTGGLGWLAVKRLSERAELLLALQGAMAYLEEEVSFRLTPLPTLFAYLSENRSGAVGNFFRLLLDGLKRTEDGTLRSVWSQAVQEGFPTLRLEERQTLEELGEVLGHYDAKTQANALKLTGERLAKLYIRAQEERARLGKVYLALGVAAGLVTVLVLI